MVRWLRRRGAWVSTAALHAHVSILRRWNFLADTLNLPRTILRFLPTFTLRGRQIYLISVAVSAPKSE